MNMSRTLTLIAIFAFMATVASAQNKFLKAADEAYKNAQYSEAIDLYKKASSKKIKKDVKVEIIFKTAESYRRNHDYKNAEVWYKKAIKAKYSDPLATLYLADALKAQEKYDEAVVSYNDYKKLAPSDPRGENGVESCKLAQKWKDAPTKYSVENVSQLNTKYNDWGVAYTKKNFKDIAFTSSREGTTGNELDPWLGQSTEDVFEAKLDKNGKWSTPAPLAAPFNSKMNEGSPASNNKYTLLYFTRCSEKKDKTVGCQIFLSKKKGATAWDEPTQIMLSPEDSFSCGDPALSPTEDTLFFSSDMPGGQGGTDVWFVTYDKKKKEWSKATNLGTTINTTGNERFPYLHDDGTFYFSSDGHLGMGGLDVFQAKKAGNKWGGVANMKYPLNSSGDDFGIVFQGQSPTGEFLEKGYLSSNRKGGKGGDDIYSFMLPPPCFTLQGVARNEQTKEVMPGVKVTVTGSDGTALEATTDATGSYMFECKPTAKFKLNTAFEVNVSKDKFINTTGIGKFDTKGLEESKDFVLDFMLLTTDKPIKLPLILFELAKWDLQPQYQDSLNGLIKTMNDNPSIVIELRSHTDSRSSFKYNEDLSFKRSKSVVDYLISKGIAGDRMVPKGMGEYELLNKCKDGVKCTEEEHQQNRRTDFKVIRNDYVAPKDPSKIEAPKIIIEDEDGEEVEPTPTDAPAPGGTTPTPPKN